MVLPYDAACKAAGLHSAAAAAAHAAPLAAAGLASARETHTHTYRGFLIREEGDVACPAAFFKSGHEKLAPAASLQIIAGDSCLLKQIVIGVSTVHTSKYAKAT